MLVTPEATADVRVGEVISYKIPVEDHHVETHRIVRIISAGRHPVVVTKGDANTAPTRGGRSSRAQRCGACGP